MPQDQVDEVKGKVDIVSLISEYITLKKAGRNYKANCPFHGEKTPSFMVSPELQIYKCFGCGQTGDAFTFLEKYEGMDFYEALKFLGSRVGVKIIPMGGSLGGEKERLYSLNNLASKFYSYILLNHPSAKKALDYLTRERGLKVGTIKHFNIGYSPQVSRPLVNFLVGKKKFHPEELVKSGLTFFKGRDLIDRFDGRIIFPLYDHRGNTIGFSGRLLPGDPREESSGKYINSPDTPIYHKSKVLYGLNWSRDSIKSLGSAIVVEGELDLISLYQADIKNVVAIKGSALTEEHADLLLRFTSKIILSLDSDIAGNMAARRGIAQAYKKGLEIKVIRLKDYKDPDEAVRKNPDAFRRAITSAVSVWDYLIEEVFKKYDSSLAEGKRKIGREVIPILASIDDSIVQAYYVEMVSKKLDVPESAVFSEVGKGKAEFETIQNTADLEAGKAKGRRQLLEEELLSTIFLFDHKLIKEKDIKDFIKTPLCKRITEEYDNYEKENKRFSISAFGKSLPRELFAGFSEMVLSKGEEESMEALERELLSVKKEIKFLDIKEKMDGLAKDMERMEKEKDKMGLVDARKEFSQLSKKLIELEEK